MSFLLYISDYIIPLLFLYITGSALLAGSDIFVDFIEGAKEGFEVTLGILPTLIGLLVAIGMLRASGTFELIEGAATLLHLPAKLVPIVVVKMFSSSAATGLLIDLYKTVGPDSYMGVLASVIMSSSETIFYTVSVYFGSIGIKKTRYVIPGAIVATMAGIIGALLVV